MGLRNLDNPGRAGDDVAKYDGWFMSFIIRDFAFNEDLTIEYNRIRMRRALLVSDEMKRFAKGERVSV